MKSSSQAVAWQYEAVGAIVAQGPLPFGYFSPKEFVPFPTSAAGGLGAIVGRFLSSSLGSVRSQRKRTRGRLMDAPPFLRAL